MIIYGIPTLNHQQYIWEKHLPSILENTVKPDMIIIYDNSLDYLWDNTPQDFLMDYNGIALDIMYARNDPESNFSLAYAWNSIMQLAVIYAEDKDVSVILANDDIILFPNTIELLLNDPHEFSYPSGAESGNSFSLFKIDVNMWLDVGKFDVNFYPAYFEDNDYHRRMLLKGYDIYSVPQAQYHHEGSGTLRAMSVEEQQKRAIAFRRCQAYFKFKWGGIHGQVAYDDMYDQPFDGMDYQEAVRLFNENYRLY